MLQRPALSSDMQVVLWLRLAKTKYITYIRRVGQNHIYTVYIRYFWRGNHQIHGHIRCIYTVLANPIYTVYIR